MREPDHKVKRHIVPLSNKQKPYWIENPVHGWLGSDIKDKNGVEIFEGDILAGGQMIFRVVFDDGRFRLWTDSRPDWWWHLIDLAGALEVIGHIATEEADNDSK